MTIPLTMFIIQSIGSIVEVFYMALGYFIFRSIRFRSEKLADQSVVMMGLSPALTYVLRHSVKDWRHPAPSRRIRVLQRG